jgi:hypothetical protein
MLSSAADRTNTPEEACLTPSFRHIVRTARPSLRLSRRCGYPSATAILLLSLGWSIFERYERAALNARAAQR